MGCLSSSAHRLASSNFFESSNDGLETVPYNPWTAYGNAKLSNLLFAKEFHRRYSISHGIQACSVMPGGIHTGLQTEVDSWIAFKWLVVTPFFFKSIKQGAATTIHAALQADLAADDQGGAYFDNCKQTKVASRMPERAGEWLWEATEAFLAEQGH